MRLLTILLMGLIAMSCNNNSPRNDAQRFIDSLNIAQRADSMVHSELRKRIMDTTGLYTSPVQVTKAILFKESYSNYKSISLTFKNVSTKKVEAIRFQWYGVDAFGEPADMGTGIEPGFGGGFDDDPLGSGKSRTSSWNILSSRGKTVKLAWPFEVAFSDGTSWKLSDYHK